MRIGIEWETIFAVPENSFSGVFKLRIELISPARHESHSGRINGKAFAFPSLALTLLAAMTPEKDEIHLSDENIEEVDFSREPDLVGITVMTSAAVRAYEIADRFRERGAQVVLGGIHPTALPNEAAQHADAVVIGEAEGVWQQLLRDVKNGGLRKFYQSAVRPRLSELPFPRREILNGKRYFLRSTMQTTRGCPFNCSFCCVTKFFGRSFRTRPINHVIREVRELRSKFIGFLDDNIVGNIPYAKRLLAQLAKEKIFWVGQASINAAQDRTLLRLLNRSGCKGLFIGFESICQENLREVGKRQNQTSRFSELIARLHDYGISVEGAFVFGFDHDDRSVFERTLSFIRRAGIDTVQFTTLTPFPGTPLFDKLSREKRILTADWSKYDCSHAVFVPKKMTPEELEKGVHEAYSEFYRLPNIAVRILSMGFRMPLQGIPAVILNLSYRRRLHHPNSRPDLSSAAMNAAALELSPH
jgi:radical SAM superfamily enzyme YgiQ (UPF0313 family)